MKKKIILSLVILILSAIVIYCAINCYNLGKLDYNLQLENHGYVKDDVTMLSHEQTVLRNIYVCIVSFGALGIITIIMCWVLGEVL